MLFRHAIAVLATGSLINGALAASSAEDRMRAARMNQCVKVLQANDKALRNNWRGHCGEDELDAEIVRSGAAPDDLPLVLEAVERDTVSSNPSPSCGGALSDVSVASGRTCGKGSRTFYENLTNKALVPIRLPGNTCGYFLPVLLTNKTDFACNAVQSRVACVDVQYDARTDRTTVVLSTQRQGIPDATQFEIGAEELARFKGHLDNLIVHPQFSLVPAKVKDRDVISAIKAAVAADREKCLEVKHSAASCDRRAVTRADAKLQELVRSYRNPRRHIDKMEMISDAKRLVAHLRSKGIDEKRENWLLFLAVAANEVGLHVSDDTITVLDPIYALSDAVVANSGLSFGAHQIDLGANDDNEVTLFWRVIDAYRATHMDDLLETARRLQACIALPLRLMTVRALDTTYRTSAVMTRALRSNEGFAEYNIRLIAYLDSAVRKTSGLTGLFQESMIFRVAYADVENQFGSGRRIVDTAREIEQTQKITTCSEVRQAEEKLLDGLIWNPLRDGVARTKTQYAYRYENIRDIVRRGAPQAGVGRCD